MKLNILSISSLEHVDPPYSSPLLDNLQYPRHIQPNHPKYQGIYIVLEHVDPPYSSPLLDNLQYPRHIQPNHPKYQGIYSTRASFLQ